MRLGDERGYSFVELITVMAILGTVIGGLTTLFIHATAAEVDMNQRFQAQQNARLALDRIRRETHCASSISPFATSTTDAPVGTIAMTLPSQCKIATGTITWCTVLVSTERYKLFRSTADPCGDAADRLYADHLTNGTPFRHFVQTSEELGKLEVSLTVDTDLRRPGSYFLKDTLVMRNTSRTCVAGQSLSPPC